MPIELKMPALSPTMEAALLAKWLVKAGDTVQVGDRLAEIETEKATMELEAVDAGTVAELLVAEGTDDVKVGQVIALIASAGETVGESSVAEQPTKRENGPSVVAEMRTAPLKDSPLKEEPREAKANGSEAPGSDSRVRASPLARRLAAAQGIDLSTVRGTGPNGRIMKGDLGLTSRPIALTAHHAGEVAPTAVYAPALGLPHEAIKLSSMRRTIARRLTEAKQTVPHFYLTVDCRLDALLGLRSELNASLVGRGVKLSVNDMLIKALAVALTRVPDANVQYAGEQMYRYSRVDISMAVAIDGGLITPVIVDAANKSLAAIAHESKHLVARARAGKLQPHEYQGGTASMSNLGMLGIREMVPVLNPPQALILGIGAGERRPHVIDEALVVATLMSVTGSFDHRAIDGALGAKFMTEFKALVEAPLSIVA
jgi:pyruvate dehydrogenase E2 component (dihydrolipoamide acetyltransferase)